MKAQATQEPNPGGLRPYRGRWVTAPIRCQGTTHRHRDHREPGEVDRGNIEELPGVAEVIRVSKPYKLVSRDVKEEDTVIRFAGTDATIGGARWR